MKNLLSFKFCKELIVSLCFWYVALTGALAQVQPVSIDLYSNGKKLDAKFYPVNTTTKAPAVVLLHGFPGNQSSPLELAEILNNAGMNILVFNYQGSFQSEGTFSFDNCIDDVGAANSFLHEPQNQAKYNIDTSNIVVCGYSFGGAMAILSGMYYDKIRNIISIANDDHSIHLKKAAVDSVYRERYIQAVGQSFEPSGPFRGDIKTLIGYFIQNVDRYDFVKNADKLKGKKIQFMVGWQDKSSLIEVYVLPLYRKLLQVDPGNVSIRGFETGHGFSNVREEMTSEIIKWITNK